ncbi:hypothetical protein JEQ12_008692 [Ovis aries]|uniref:Uncharacterized protein n=1 Tax=Ovis aries TaxID=9940 RepID=A0A836A9P3_SHEEP|nr:hypothetical protein JEQ12_008692 [Ovis aries]
MEKQLSGQVSKPKHEGQTGGLDIVSCRLGYAPSIIVSIFGCSGLQHVGSLVTQLKSFQTAVNEHFRDTTPDCLGKAVKFDRHLSKDFKHETERKTWSSRSLAYEVQ